MNSKNEQQNKKPNPLRKLLQTPEIQKYCDKFKKQLPNDDKKNDQNPIRPYKTRESLPYSAEDFQNELNQAKQKTISENFQSTKNIVINEMNKKENNMLIEGKANKQQWYELYIQCDQHLWINYNMLKDYAHYLAQFITSRIIEEYSDLDENKLLSKVQGNLAFLGQIRRVCDATFVGLNPDKVSDEDKKAHSKVLKRIDSCIETIKKVQSCLQEQSKKEKEEDEEQQQQKQREQDKI